MLQIFYYSLTSDFRALHSICHQTTILFSFSDSFHLVPFRRTFNEQILHIIKEGGPFSTMHTLLINLQTALQDQCPVMAGLLLQLDLLV